MYFMIPSLELNRNEYRYSKTRPKKKSLKDLLMVSIAVVTVCCKPLLQEIYCTTYLYLMIRVKTYNVDKLSSPRRA